MWDYGEFLLFELIIVVDVVALFKSRMATNENKNYTSVKIVYT